MVSIPHFTVPFQLDPATGYIEVVEQDTEQDIQQCVVALLRTEIDSRLELPDYGIPPVLFVERIDNSGIITAINKWEKRANVLTTDIPDSADELQRWVEVSIGSRTGV